MEPPAKRLRILQSVDVDESNPDYVRSRAKGDALMKKKWESVFDKYGAMHASMSDEIDMVTGKVVVDNGHLRRLVRQQRQMRTSLLDGLLLEDGDHTEGDEERDEAGEARDELAPSQSPEPQQRKRAEKDDNSAHSTKAHDEQATPRQKGKQVTLQPLIATPNEPLRPNGQTPLANSSNAAADLMQLVQFPQTPNGQQAQNAFLASLTQTINQAVQQAVTPFLSSLLGNIENAQPGTVNALQAPSTPTTTSDHVKPAIDPKWYFPPLPDGSSKPSLTQSSPIHGSFEAPHTKSLFPRKNDIFAVPEDLMNNTSMNTSKSLTTSTKNSDAQLPKTLADTLDCHKRLHASRFSKFREGDDIYIFKQRIVYKRSWPEIRDSRPEWKNLPLYIFTNHWRAHLKGMELELDNLYPPVSPEPENLPCLSPIKSRDSHAESHHLPTPSSLEHVEEKSQLEEAQDLAQDRIEEITASSGHFDDDDQELLSLAGAEEMHEATPFEENDIGMFVPAPDEDILPSIEMTPIVEEDYIQQELSMDSYEDDAVHDKPRSPVLKDVVSEAPSPKSKRDQPQKPIVFELQPDSDSDIHPGDIGTSLSVKRSNLGDISNESFRTGKTLKQHYRNPCSTRDKLKHDSMLNSGLATSSSPTPDLVAQGELQASVTPSVKIKSESCTPPPNLLSMSLLQTPKSAPQPIIEQSSEEKQHASKASRSAFLKRVKQSWAKKPGRSTPVKRSAFQAVPKKRVWVDEDSEDELAI